ncbi:hypothetical protein NOC27_843 [Nitrosococcus oceani AFC27]|nr:hypothetical protein NOC27_843 [Nitrosococcus oceani AFC27]
MGMQLSKTPYIFFVERVCDFTLYKHRNRLIHLVAHHAADNGM